MGSDYRGLRAAGGDQRRLRAVGSGQRVAMAFELSQSAFKIIVLLHVLEDRLGAYDSPAKKVYSQAHNDK